METSGDLMAPWIRAPMWEPGFHVLSRGNVACHFRPAGAAFLTAAEHNRVSFKKKKKKTTAKEWGHNKSRYNERAPLCFHIKRLRRVDWFFFFSHPNCCQEEKKSPGTSSECNAYKHSWASFELRDVLNIWSLASTVHTFDCDPKYTFHSKCI